MLRGRIGGTGAKFNVGEMTVTRCALRLEHGAAGVGYVQGRSARKAELVAIADAMLQLPGFLQEVQASLITPVRARLQADAERARRKVQATRVEFFTLARESAE